MTFDPQRSIGFDLYDYDLCSEHVEKGSWKMGRGRKVVGIGESDFEKKHVNSRTYDMFSVRYNK